MGKELRFGGAQIWGRSFQVGERALVCIGDETGTSRRRVDQLCVGVTLALRFVLKREILLGGTSLSPTLHKFILRFIL